MFGKRDRLAVRIFGLLGAVAEGPIAIFGLVLIVLLITQARCGHGSKQQVLDRLSRLLSGYPHGRRCYSPTGIQIFVYRILIYAHSRISGHRRNGRSRGPKTNKGLPVSDDLRGEGGPVGKHLFADSGPFDPGKAIFGGFPWESGRRVPALSAYATKMDRSLVRA
jgi:hypothetical protein